MASRIAIALVATFVVASGLQEVLPAQETIFNVPSPDVLEAGRLYVETDQYVRSWNTRSGRAGFFLLRAVAGVGHAVEIGLNSGSFDYRHASEPFVDATVKWRPLRTATAGVVIGDNTGRGVGGRSPAALRSLGYASGFVVAPSTRTRAAVGPYCATRNVFGDAARCGALLTVEQPVFGPGGFELAADWFSGAGGYATAGVIGTIHRVALYAGYGFANTGRQDDLVTLELGLTLF